MELTLEQQEDFKSRCAEFNIVFKALLKEKQLSMAFKPAFVEKILKNEKGEEDQVFTTQVQVQYSDTKYAPKEPVEVVREGVPSLDAEVNPNIQDAIIKED